MTGRKYPISERAAIAPPGGDLSDAPLGRQERTTMSSTSAPNRRAFLARGAAIAAVPAAAALAGGALAEPASAGTLPGYAPVPPSALGPAVNAQGYYVGPAQEHLDWAT